MWCVIVIWVFGVYNSHSLLESSVLIYPIVSSKYLIIKGKRKYYCIIKLPGTSSRRRQLLTKITKSKYLVELKKAKCAKIEWLESCIEGHTTGDASSGESVSASMLQASPTQQRLQLHKKYWWSCILFFHFRILKHYSCTSLRLLCQNLVNSNLNSDFVYISVCMFVLIHLDFSITNCHNSDSATCNMVLLID